MKDNQYIQYIYKYIEENTPVAFIFHKEKYQEMLNELNREKLDNVDKELISACYSLFYTGLSYHKLAETDELNQPYDILLGDFVSSYVAEILYKHQYIDILKVFAISTKQITLNLLNNNKSDNLLKNIIESLKKQV